MHITTQRIKIRKLEPEDLDNFFQYRSNPEVTRYQGFDIMSRDEAIQFIKDESHKHFGVTGEWMQFGIELSELQELVGDCAAKLSAEEDGTAEIGITISPDHQRTGLGLEAAHTLIDYLFSEKQLHRVIAITDTRNIASINLLRKAGFRLEGNYLNNIFFKGEWGSEYQFAMLRDEWDRQQSLSEGYRRIP